MKDQATERYGVVPKEMTDGVAKVNKEYDLTKNRNPLSLSSIDRSAESLQSLQSSVCRAGLLTLPSPGLLAFLDLTLQ